jgi:hypothetical protein
MEDFRNINSSSSIKLNTLFVLKTNQIHYFFSGVIIFFRFPQQDGINYDEDESLFGHYMTRPTEIRREMTGHNCNIPVDEGMSFLFMAHSSQIPSVMLLSQDNVDINFTSDFCEVANSGKRSRRKDCAPIGKLFLHE